MTGMRSRTCGQHDQNDCSAHTPNATPLGPLADELRPGDNGGMDATHLMRLQDELTAFLEAMMADLGRADRRRWALTYVRGLLLDGDRKSAGAMAERLAAVDHSARDYEQALQQPLRGPGLRAGPPAATSRAGRGGGGTPPGRWGCWRTPSPPRPARRGKRGGGATGPQ